MAKKFKINASDGSIKRYSDVVPQEKRRYWYFTTHGIGPGMLPSDVKILETKEGQNKKGTWGDFICLDSVLNTDELKAYDLIELAPDMVESACGNKKSVKSATRKPLRKQAVKANWASKGKKQKIYKSFELGNYFLFELGKDFIGISINNSYPDGKAWLGARTVTCDDAKGLFTYLQKNLTEDATWNQIERTIAKSGFDVKIDDMGGFISDKNMRKPAKSVDSACSKKKSVKASSVDGDRPNSAPNSWKSSERMAYKVTDEDTKGEKSFPTDIDDVYKALGEMQGTWTNPTTGWTGDCEIFERDLDDGSYIFSLVFGGNELEPDDILYDPNGFNYYSNKPKFTIYPHSGAPTFADSLEDFKRKLKKEYSYLRKVDDASSSTKKSTVKASAIAKFKAAQAVKAGINAPSTDGPLCVCEYCKEAIESHEGRQIVYNVISEFDIEPDEKLICDWCEEESTELYQISPDDVEGAKKAVKCSDVNDFSKRKGLSRYSEERVLDAMDVLGYKLWGPASSKGKVEFYNPTYAPGSVITFSSWAEVEDYLDDIVKNGISDRAYSYEEQDYMPELIEGILEGRTESSIWDELRQWEDMQAEEIESSTDVNADLQLNKNASDRKKYNWGKNPITDLDGYVKDIADGVVERFPNLTYEISDEAITFTNNDSGEVVYIQSIDEIVPEKEDLENDTEELSNAIQHEQEEADWYNQNTDTVEMSTSDDELEPIMGDGFGEDDMGYGFDSNGEVITESVVEELYRIAEQDVLQHSKLAEIDEYVSIDEDSWKFYKASPSVSVDFYIHFKITERDIDFNSYVLPEANTVPDFNYYTADLDFDIYTKNGEITDVVLEEVKIYRPDGAYDEYDVAKFDTTFNKEAIINYVEHLAGDTVSDIYNAVTNL